MKKHKLGLVCSFPLLSAQDEFARPNEVVAIRVTVVVIFLVGLSQLVFWTCALLSKLV